MSSQILCWTNYIYTNIVDGDLKSKSYNQTTIMRESNVSIKNEQSLQVLKKFRIIYGSVRQNFREVEQACGVSGSQLWLMQEIANMPEIGVSELADRLAIHQSTCSQLVEKLVVRKLVVKERSRADQRRVGLYLTQSALEIVNSAPGPSEGILPQALGSLSAEEMGALDDALARVIEKLQSRDEKLAEKPLSAW